jgi:hypothetical protein
MARLKIMLAGRVEGTAEEGYTVPYALEIDGPIGEAMRMPANKLLESPYDPNAEDAVPLVDGPLFSVSDGRRYVYRGHVVKVIGYEDVPRDELQLRIKHSVLKTQKQLDKIRREVQALANLEKLPDARRESIPDDVRMFVWQRDQGKCSKCGSQERLEFDHIIPVVKGGANTARNIRLLCERCNREKGAEIC